MRLIHYPRSFASIGRASLALVMLALALLGSARPAAAAATVNATPLAGGFQFSAQNSSAVVWDLQVSFSSIGFIGSTPVFPSGALVHKANSKGIAQTSFAPFLGGLFPNTSYNYIMTMSNSAGTSYSYGPIGKTLQRSVVISFNSLTVTNDSDDLGKGELTYQFKVNGVYHPEFDFFRATSSGETINPNRSLSQTNGGRTIPLAVELQDDDCDFSTCVRPADFTSGSDSDNDWATAATSITFFEQSNSYSKTFSYSVDKAVGFKGTALAQVVYFR